MDNLQPLSWISVRVPPCFVVLPEKDQPPNYDKDKNCPTFYAGTEILFARLDNFLARHEKSIIGGFTVVLAIGTLLLWRATRDLRESTDKLWDAGERQMKMVAAHADQQSTDMQASIKVAEAANALNRDIFTATQRPWLHAEVSLAGPFHAGPQHGGSGMIDLQIAVKNVGPTPAFNIHCHTATHPGLYGGTAVQDFTQYRFELAKQPVSRPGYGEVMFPTDPPRFLSAGQTFASWYQSNIDIGVAKGAGGDPKGPLVIFVVIQYASVVADTHFQTAFMFHLMRRDGPHVVRQEGEGRFVGLGGGNRWISFKITDGPIPQEELWQMPHPVGRYIS